MTNKRSSSPVAGGAAIAICAIAGVVVGSIARQPSLGFIAGVAIGVAIAVSIWLWDRGRR